MIHMNNIFYLMKNIVKKDPVCETKNPTTNHFKFQSNESNIKNYSEIKYQCNDIDFYSSSSFGNEINNCNGNIIDNFSDNNAHTFEHQNNMTQKENIQVEVKKEEEEINIKEEKNKKKEKQISKKRKRYKSKENREIYPKKIFETKMEKENQKKIGYNIEKKSKRESNQLEMFKRNLIQDIFIDWTNEGEVIKIKD